MIATPEKALCDLNANSYGANLRYLKDVSFYIEEDIRMELSDFRQMNTAILEEYAKSGEGLFNPGTIKTVEAMKNDIYDRMLYAYDLSIEQQKRDVIFEVNQQVMLAGLHNCGFFDEASFYGGTCLRIFHGLQCLSENMDFSLLTPYVDFDFTKYFQPIIDEFAIVGWEVQITKKEKKSFGKVESALLKKATDVYDVSFQTDKSIRIKSPVCFDLKRSWHRQTLIKSRVTCFHS